MFFNTQSIIPNSMRRNIRQLTRTLFYIQRGLGNKNDLAVFLAQLCFLTKIVRMDKPMQAGWMCPEVSAPRNILS